MNHFNIKTVEKAGDFSFASQALMESQSLLVHDCKQTFTEGHFPDKAVLPAFALLILAQECLEVLYTDSFLVENSKFKSPLNPKERLEARVTKVSDDKVNVELSQNGNIGAQITLKIS